MDLINAGVAASETLKKEGINRNKYIFLYTYPSYVLLNLYKFHSKPHSISILPFF
jgi:hypothetical protein